MNEESYQFIKEPEVFYYEFFSEGPNGKIRKIVQFQQLSKEEEIFNLGFGDFDEQNQDIDDLSVSNNQDTQKVLTTVAKTVMDFIQQHPKAIVLAKGSTLSRTRLYQMDILKFWNEIEHLFDVKAFNGREWQPFEKGKNFESFFIVKK